MLNQIKTTGTHIQYYMVCHRKLWLFAHQIQCEQESDLVQYGKFIHETSYSEEKKDFDFDSIKLDWLDTKNKIIHEVKKSNKMENSHIQQLKYYLYFFKINNIGEYYGELDYPKLKKKLKISLKPEDIKEIEDYITKINQIINLQEPPKIPEKMKICKNCSYYELCWI